MHEINPVSTHVKISTCSDLSKEEASAKWLASITESVHVISCMICYHNDERMCVRHNFSQYKIQHSCMAHLNTIHSHVVTDNHDKERKQNKTNNHVRSNHNGDKLFQSVKWISTCKN